MRWHVLVPNSRACVLLWGPSTACASARTGKALCLSHPHDHSNLTAEANESHSWGWEDFASFSTGESPAGFFTEARGRRVGGGVAYTGGGWIPQVKNNYWKILSRSHVPKHNVHGRQETGSCEQKLLHMRPAQRTIFISTGLKSFICFCFHDTALYLVCRLNFLGYRPCCFVLFLPEDTFWVGSRSSSFPHFPNCMA